MFKVIIPVLFLLMAGCASTESTDNEASAADANTVAKTAKASKDKPKMVCKYERQTGSNMAVQVCRTVAQMEEDRKQAAKLLRRSGSAPSQGDN